MTNKPAQVKKTQKEPKPKATGPSSSARIAHMRMHMNRYNCNTQYSSDTHYPQDPILHPGELQTWFHYVLKNHIQGLFKECIYDHQGPSK